MQATLNTALGRMLRIDITLSLEECVKCTVLVIDMICGTVCACR